MNPQERKQGKTLAVNSEYRFLGSPELRHRILERGRQLVELVSSQQYDTLIIVDRSARPIAWVFEDLWARIHPNIAMPSLVFLNTGQKSLRQKYMEGVGSACWGGEDRSFVGIYDTDENIELFKQRVRADEKTKMQLAEELGSEGAQKLTNKKVIIVDDIEFEGVSRMFIEEIIDELYRPEILDYFEWGERCPIIMPTGLSEKAYDPSFIAKPGQDPEQLQLAQVAREEITRLVASTEM